MNQVKFTCTNGLLTILQCACMLNKDFLKCFFQTTLITVLGALIRLAAAAALNMTLETITCICVYMCVCGCTVLSHCVVVWFLM